jgi:hypothetical protein
MAGRLLPWVLLLGLALAQGVRTSITPGEVEALLKSGSYRYERVENKGQVYFRLRLAGLRAALYLLDCQEGRCESLHWTYAASTCTGNRGLKSRLSLPAMSLRRHW